jgi:hypothetical protein
MSLLNQTLWIKFCQCSLHLTSDSSSSGRRTFAIVVARRNLAHGFGLSIDRFFVLSDVGLGANESGAVDIEYVLEWVVRGDELTLLFDVGPSCDRCRTESLCTEMWIEASPDSF